MNQKMIEIDNEIESLKECENCQDIQIKKFNPLKELIDFNELNDDYKRCVCGKRPLDIVMSHILKIMIEEEVVRENATLRHDTPIPLSGFYFSNLNPQFIGKDMLILIHSNFNKKVAERLVNEVSEVKGVLKGSGQDTVGQFDKNSQIRHFELLAGEDRQTNVMRTLINDKIVIVKNQSEQHIEVAMTTEQKLIQLHNYLENNNIKKGVALDGMCGIGALGIYLLKYGFEKVIFNDINPEAIEALKENLKINGIDEGFEIENQAFEDLKIDKLDLCVIDAFPGFDLEEVRKKGEEIADNLIII